MMTKSIFTKTLDRIATWSVFAVLFTLPFSKSMVEIFITIAVLSFVSKKIALREKLFVATYVDAALLIYLLACAISIFNTEPSQLNLSLKALFSKAFKFAALFVIAREVIDSDRKLKSFIIVAALSCALILTDCFIQYFITHRDLLHYPGYVPFLYIGQKEFLGYPTASFPFPNDFAAWILIYIFPVFSLLLYSIRSKLRPAIAALCAILLAALAYSLMITKVRGAWLGFAVSFAAMSIVKLKKMGWVLLIVLVLITLSLNTFAHMFSMQSINDRSVMWKNSVEIFRKHPVIGNGLNTFYDNYMKIRQDSWKNSHGSYAHNCYLQMAADTGLFGLLAFFLFAAAAFFKAYVFLKRRTDGLCYYLTLGIMFGLLAFLVHSAVDTNLYSLPLATLFWLSAGAMLAVVKISERKA